MMTLVPIFILNLVADTRILVTPFPYNSFTLLYAFYYTHYVRFIFIVSDCGPDILYGKVIAKGVYLER